MNQMTTGATNDFERATDIARNMVSRWGMSDVLGTRVYGDNESEVFLGRDVMTHKNLSDKTAQLVDDEIRRIIDEQYDRARKVIEENRDKIEAIAAALLEWETLESNQIDEIMAGKKPSPPSPPSPHEDTGGAPGKDKPDSGVTPTGSSSGPNLDKPAGEH